MAASTVTPTSGFTSDRADTVLEQRKPTMLSAIEDKMRAANKKNILHRMVCISMLRHQAQDPSDVGNEYKKFFKELQNIQQSEPVTGLMLIYHQHIVHVVETSDEMIRKLIKNMYQSEHDRHGILSRSKILGVTHDIQERLYSQWCFRTLDIEAHNIDQYEPSEDTLKVVSDMLIQVFKLGLYLHRKPTLNLKNVLDFLYDHVPELLPQQAIIHFLLRTHDNSMISPGEYMRMYTKPADFTLESEQVWPLDADKIFSVK